MTQYNILNATLSNLQLNKLKLGIKNVNEVTLKISPNVIGDSNDENNFPHKLLLTNTQVSRLPKDFANGSSANVKLSKIQLHKTGQSGRFLGRFLGPLLKTGLPLTGNVLKCIKGILIPLGLTSTASATDAAIHMKAFGLGMTKMTLSNEEMNDIVKIIKSLEESSLIIKGIRD